MGPEREKEEGRRKGQLGRDEKKALSGLGGSERRQAREKN
jgi:hypothetical protein